MHWDVIEDIWNWKISKASMQDLLVLYQKCPCMKLFLLYKLQSSKVQKIAYDEDRSVFLLNIQEIEDSIVAKSWNMQNEPYKYLT